MTSHFDPYLRRADLARVIDGDTVVLHIDLGWHITVDYAVRLLGVNSPEKRGITKAAGDAAQNYTQGWFERYDEPGPWPLHPALGEGREVRPVPGHHLEPPDGDVPPKVDVQDHGVTVDDPCKVSPGEGTGRKWEVMG